MGSINIYSKFGVPNLFGKLFRVVKHVLREGVHGPTAVPKIIMRQLDENINKAIRRHIIGFRFCDLQL